MADPIPPKGFLLKDKIILQIGGSGLLGPALSWAIGEAGGTLVVTSRDQIKLEPGAERARAAGHAFFPETCAFDSEASILSLRDRVMARHGRVDGLVYNAMNYTMRGGWSDDLSRWQASMESNSTLFFCALRAFGEAMAFRHSGSLVTIGSIHGLVGPNPFLYEGTVMKSAPDYFFHKAGMNNLIRYVATYYGPHGVRANVVAPGGIYDARNPDPDSFLERYGKMTALGRMANPEEITGAVIFLLSDASTYVTGVTLPVDGGYSAR